MILKRPCMPMTIWGIRGKMWQIWSVKSNIRLDGIILWKETGDTHWTTSCVCVKTWWDPFVWKKFVAWKERSVCKLRSMLKTLKNTKLWLTGWSYVRDIVNLCFKRLYIMFTNRQGWDMDGSMALLGIKKSRLVWILNIMIKTIKIFQNMIYYTFL